MGRNGFGDDAPRARKAQPQDQWAAIVRVRLQGRKPTTKEVKRRGRKGERKKGWGVGDCDLSAA